MITLFGSDGSGSAAVEIALRRCGLRHEVCAASSWADRSQPAAQAAFDALERVNPLGQIPVLQLPDGSVLTESAAILVHLGLEHPGSGLLPAQAAARARSIRGLVYIAANPYAAIGVIDHPDRWCPDADAAGLERLRAGARARLHRYWEVFADAFPGEPFLAGAAPGALDFLACVVTRWSGGRGHLRSRRPGLLALLERVDADPAAAPVLARHFPEARGA